MKTELREITMAKGGKQAGESSKALAEASEEREAKRGQGPPIEIAKPLTLLLGAAIGAIAESRAADGP